MNFDKLKEQMQIAYTEGTAIDAYYARIILDLLEQLQTKQSNEELTVNWDVEK